MSGDGAFTLPPPPSPTTSRMTFWSPAGFLSSRRILVGFVGLHGANIQITTIPAPALFKTAHLNSLAFASRRGRSPPRRIRCAQDSYRSRFSSTMAFRLRVGVPERRKLITGKLSKKWIHSPSPSRKPSTRSIPTALFRIAP